jgi:hypothetical protein
MKYLKCRETYVCELAFLYRFMPMQCYSHRSPKFPECWCVDEAGNQLPNTGTFRKGSKICCELQSSHISIYMLWNKHLMVNLIKLNVVMVIVLSNVQSLTKGHSSSLTASYNAVICTSLDKQYSYWHSMSHHLISNVATGTMSASHSQLLFSCRVSISS